MLLFYSTLYDFTHDHQDVNVKIEKVLNDKQILMRAESFDKPDNFFAEIILPELTVEKNIGFTEDDIIELRVFLLRNESIIREMLEDMST